MLRIFLPLTFGMLFLAWICYQLFVKKALKQHLEVLYIGLSFVLIWGVLFFSPLVAINQLKRLLTERTLELLNEMALSHKWN